MARLAGGVRQMETRCRKQFRRWCERPGVWDLLLQALADGGGTLDMLQMIDSTIVRAQSLRRAGEKTGRAKSSTRSFARRVPAPRSMCVATPQVSPIPGSHSSEGEAHDVTAYDGLMQQRDSDPGAMLADKGYDSDTIRHDLRDSSATPEIPSRSNRKVQVHRSADPLLCAAVTD